MTSAKARPIQSRPGLGLRFSKRRIASRWIAGWGARAQDWNTIGSRQTRDREQACRHLKNTLFLGEEFLEFGQLAQGSEIGFLFQLVLLFEPLFQALAQVLHCQLVAPALRVQLREVEVILRALLYAALFEYYANIAVTLEHFGV